MSSMRNLVLNIHIWQKKSTAASKYEQLISPLKGKAHVIRFTRLLASKILTLFLTMHDIIHKRLIFK